MFSSLSTAVTVDNLSKHGQGVTGFSVPTTQTSDAKSDFQVNVQKETYPTEYQPKISLAANTTHNLGTDPLSVAQPKYGVTSSKIMQKKDGGESYGRADADHSRLSSNKSALLLRKTRSPAVSDYGDIAPLIPPEFGLIIVSRHFLQPHSSWLPCHCLF